MLIKVLIVDDDVEMTELLKVLLEPNSFVVSAANDAQEGIELARNIDPDVMIIDQFLPGLEGWQVCKEIRKFSKVPILILSVNNAPALVARSLDAGADDYLCKPVTSNILIAHLKSLVRRAKIEKASKTPVLGYSR